MAAAPPTRAQARSCQPPRSQRETPAAKTPATPATPSPRPPTPTRRRATGVDPRCLPSLETKRAVRAKPRTEVLVERPEADDREHDGGEATPEGGSVERAGDGIGPGRAEDIRQEARIEKKPISDHAADREQPARQRARCRHPVL